MAINNDDVKLYESQRLTDENDGGGRVTGNEVADGAVNNLFQDISRIDRTIGDVALRKAFVGINTDNNDAYLGGHVILTEAPADPNVSVLLFNTGDHTDERNSASNRIESYVVSGSSARFELLGNQFVGQRNIVGVQRQEQPLPEVGEVFRLYDEASGKEQYVRLTAVDHRIEPYTYEVSDSNFIEFERRRLDMEISAPLAFTFPGGQPTPASTTEPKSMVNSTQVADASRYYGIKPLAKAVSQGDLTLKVESLYSALVPSARVESPLLDQNGGYTAKTMVATAAGIRSLSCSLVHIAGNQSRTFLQSGARPGTVHLTLEGGDFVDDEKGNIIHNSGSNYYRLLKIDYETGEINVWRNSEYTTTTASVSYQPATAITGMAISSTLEVTLQNRGFNYTLNLAEAKPRPGTLVVSFIALGKWYELRDPGNGQLTGSGSGTIDFSTGSTALTLDALPDPDSAIVYSYVAQDDAGVTIRTGTALVEQIRFRHTTEHDGIQPGSITINYLSNGNQKSVSDQANGLLSGDGEGSVHYASGELSFVLDFLPDDSSEIAINYQQGEVAGGTTDVQIDGSGLMTGTIAGAPLLPGSVQLQFSVEQDRQVWNGHAAEAYQTHTTTRLVSKSYSDDGSGKWRGATGTLDYATGAFSLQALADYGFTEYATRTNVFGTIYKVERSQTTKTEAFPGNTVSSKAQHNSISHTPHTENLSNPELTIDLLPLIKDPLLPGSLIFSWNSETYFDRDGKLYKSISTRTNAGTQVGTIDYSGGVATLASYKPGGLNSASIQAAATISAGIQVDAVAFRTPGAPVRPGSLQLTAVRVDTADTLTATADFDGLFNTAEVQGKIDASTGWCEIRFTNGNSPDGKPIHVIPQSIRYNAVVETSLPLDAELIGLDPVRLPPDGRVPVYRPGDIVVVSHTASTDAGTPSAGQVVDLARDHQAEIWVEDSNGTRLKANQYAVTRDTGKVTFAAPLALNDDDGNALVAPLTIKDRVEHMTVVSDARINGELAIIAPVPWDLPADATTVSSAVVYGDLQARSYNFFSQKVWDSGDPNWSDQRIGENTTAQYNTVNYPLEVTNKGAIQGKWALIFTSTGSYQVVEQKLGIIATGSIAEDMSPVNPENGAPYFTLRATGWGTGWTAGNVVRFDTEGCLAPLWICRTVLAGQGTEKNDRFTLQIRGDAD